MADVIEYKWRRRAVRETLANDATLQATALVSPFVVSRYPVTKKVAAIAVLATAAGAEGRFGWRGGVIDRYTVDVYVNASAGDPCRRRSTI